MRAATSVSVLFRAGAVCVAAALPGPAAADSQSIGRDGFTCPTPGGSTHPPLGPAKSHPSSQTTVPAAEPIVIPPIPVSQA